MPPVHGPEAMPAVNGSFQPDHQKTGRVLEKPDFPGASNVKNRQTAVFLRQQQK